MTYADAQAPVSPPEDAPLELERLRRNVRAQLFHETPEPTRIGRFRLLDCIGRGGMGVVWSAHDDELDRTVAIKLLRPELSGRDLTAEARALARLAHPNVVSVFDVGEHEGQRFIAMEHVEGVTLRDWLEPARDPSEVIEMFVAAGQGLAAAHAVGLVHRDFKPDNVLVGRDGRPRVLDFGLARPPDTGSQTPPAVPADADPFATTMTHAGVLLGTPAYMAPEQHLGEPADTRSDQFAFAVSLFEGLTRELPFVGEDLRTLSLAVVRGRVASASLDRLPSPVRLVLERALAVEAERRFPDMNAMLDALRSTRGSADLRFDTQQVDAVLARAAELQQAVPSRPGLSPSEVEAVGAEAGFDPAVVRQAAAEAVTPAPKKDPPPALAKSPPPESGTFDDVVSVKRECAPIGPEVAALMARSLELEQGGGKIEQLGASTTWRSRSMELRVDPAGDRTRLVLKQRLGLRDRTRAWRYGLLGVYAAVATVIPVFVEAFPRAEGVVVMMVFSSMGLGAFIGRKLGLRRHRALLERQRAALGETADGLLALADANRAHPR